MSSDGVLKPPGGGYFAELRGSTPTAAVAPPSYQQQFLATAIAGKGDRRLALVVVLLSALGFVAAVPFAQVMLVPVSAFIPAYEAALILISGITAVMLFGQYRGSRSPALLLLAAGFLYDMCLTAAHALSFPDAFAPGGLLGGGQTTVWLFCFWHGGFPVFVIAYALLNARKSGHDKSDGSVGPAWVSLTVLATAALAAALTALAANHDMLLPTLMNGNAQLPIATIALSATWILGLAALGVLWRRSRHTVLDLWLMVMLCAWVFDIALSAVFNHQRFDLGFYAGRAYGLLAASFVLGTLLVEVGGLHSRLTAAMALLDDYAHGLEERVRGRTAELAVANQTLVAETGERRKAEAALYQAQKMEALGQLTGGLAHDFNNHLGIIIGNLDLLGEGAGQNPDDKELIDDALAAAFSGADLTRRLLAFARRQPLRPERIDANQRVGEIAKLLRRTLGERVEIMLNFDASIRAVSADPAQLETAIANLANNARDAMPDGGTLTITTGQRFLDEDYAREHSEVTPGGYVMIEVSDTGTGMSPEVAERIFEPFFTTKEPGKGTGLGLSMVFGFIKQSGGHINVYSEVGRGTTFRLYLRPDEASAEAAIDPGGNIETLRGNGERILVVEDNIKLRAVLMKQLVELGYQVSAAGTAAEALALIDVGAAIDLLLTDIVMPGKLDGCALAQEFVARRPSGKVVLTSGFPSSRLGEIEGLDAHLRLLDKPYRKQDLARVLRETFADPAPTPVLAVSLTGC
jgi:signal transduction histidine kinase/ActR/RegA family two-component response regulator